MQSLLREEQRRKGEEEFGRRSRHSVVPTAVVPLSFQRSNQSD